jgi:hypothetical protein
MGQPCEFQVVATGRAPRRPDRDDLDGQWLVGGAADGRVAELLAEVLRERIRVGGRARVLLILPGALFTY